VRYLTNVLLPVLEYGSEVGGTDVHRSIEMVHIKFCKNLLGVGSKTPTPAVLGEFGRDGTYDYCMAKCVIYWLKLTSLSPVIISNQCLVGKINWASKIRDILYKYGFGWICENQGVPDRIAFMKILAGVPGVARAKRK
jgi:hypothetical protein